MTAGNQGRRWLHEAVPKDRASHGCRTRRPGAPGRTPPFPLLGALQSGLTKPTYSHQTGNPRPQG